MPTAVVPKASPETLPELAAYLAPYAPLFRRTTSRASVARYLTGLLTDLPRKNCDTIAAAVAGTSTERLQHLLTDATWEPQALDLQRVTGLGRPESAPGHTGLRRHWGARHSSGFSGGQLSSQVEGSAALDFPLIHDTRSQNLL